MSAIHSFQTIGGDITFITVATCFGGPEDTADNGLGAWEFPYRAYADTLPYCALPTRGSVPSLDDSPIPATLPHYYPVKVYYPPTGKFVWCTFVDVGPKGGLPSGAGIDLGPAAVKALGYTGDPNNFSGTVRVRIPNAAHFIPHE